MSKIVVLKNKVSPFEERTIRIRVSVPWDTLEIENTSIPYDEDNMKAYHRPTLKDIAIFLYQLCGQGVQWQLAREINEKTGFDLVKINTALGKIIHKYAIMSDKEAIQKAEDSKGFIYEEI